MTAEPTSWLAYRRPHKDARVRLFCFPYAGAGASIYRDWLLEPTSEIEVCPVQLPGRESRFKESLFKTMEPLVAALAKGLAGYLDKPFAFFGHSMGALISYELARHLRRERNISPLHLFASARRAPQVISTSPPIHTLPRAEFIKRLREIEGINEGVLQGTELMDFLLPILRADFGLCETYQYVNEAALDCPMTVFGGTEDDHVTLSDLSAWREQTSSRYRLRMFPGDHFFLRRFPRELTRAIAENLL